MVILPPRLQVEAWPFRNLGAQYWCKYQPKFQNAEHQVVINFWCFLLWTSTGSAHASGQHGIVERSRSWKRSNKRRGSIHLCYLSSYHAMVLLESAGWLVTVRPSAIRGGGPMTRDVTGPGWPTWRGDVVRESDWLPWPRDPIQAGRFQLSVWRGEAHPIPITLLQSYGPAYYLTLCRGGLMPCMILSVFIDEIPFCSPI